MDHVLLKDQLNSYVPFSAHSGVKVTDVSDHSGAAVLPDSAFSRNHIGSQHAGALFTLGEAASGAAMAGVFSEQLADVWPVATGASIDYLQVAKGEIVAAAHVGQPVSDLMLQLNVNGEVRFPVNVQLEDSAGQCVARMTVNWLVSRKRA